MRFRKKTIAKLAVTLTVMIIWSNHSVASRPTTHNIQKREDDDCPAWAWSCKWKTRDSPEQFRKPMQLQKRLMLPQGTGCTYSPPGIWSCTGEIRGKLEEQLNTKQSQKRQNPLCPPGVWSCKSRKQSIIVKRQNPNCPPGMWSCKAKIRAL